MRTLARAVALLALLAAPLLAQALAEDPALAPQAPLPASKDLYSFADLYRVAVGATPGSTGGSASGTAARGAELPAPWSAAEPAEASQFRVRTVAGPAPAAAHAAAYVFSISRVARSDGALLFFAGLAAVLWVARRRLGYPIRR